MKFNRKQLGGLLLFLISFSGFTSCKEYLDAKPDQHLQIPSTLQDLQSLLDNRVYVADYDVTNLNAFSDDYFCTYENWQTFPTSDQNVYIWSHQNVFPPYDQNDGNDWSFAYDHVYIANTILENIEKISVDNSDISTYQNIKGQAYYLRAWSLLEAAWIWCQAFDSSTAASNLGLPLRLTTDFNVKSVRSTLQETYNQIISDAKNAIALLPQTPISTVRASKPAAYALLSRIYLSMRDYDHAGKCSDSCLQLKNDLMNYNTLDSTKTYPFSKFNIEVIKDGAHGLSYCTYPAFANIDTALIKQYEPNDLRKVMFFSQAGAGYYSFRGDYNEGLTWVGIATDEMYITRAECYARNG
ncbi:Starch-binding associating with outer membrane [bacterium A37T11]|nr:Starch-binding associating with outer membrane [bacterium A37T11]